MADLREPSDREESEGPRRSARANFALAGAALGWVVPAAALLARVLIGKVAWRVEIREHAFFYAFAFAATTVLLALFGAVAGSRIDRVRRRRDWYRNKSRHDDLTGFLVPSAFRQALSHVIDEARAEQAPIALLLLAVDGAAGSEAEHGSGLTKSILLHLAAAVRRIAPPDAILARWGGLEIAILLPSAQFRLDELPQKLCEQIAERPVFDAGSRIFCKARVGGYYGVPVLSADRIVLQAQDALAEVYRKGGRIRIGVA
ncbi:MAG TPA: diguanylate cyclase [Thermoanaerobaculia bacterium]|nr:diguanylate cyclase [Thermoanaerobaculia bacterium]